MIFHDVLGYFFMKNRSSVIQISQEFYVEIKNQFDTFIKVLRTDNAREYMSSQLQSFLTSQGIIHKSSCTHTPQQNGVTEWKSHHLVELHELFYFTTMSLLVFGLILF